jgi:hypothetical protein
MSAVIDEAIDEFRNCPSLLQRGRGDTGSDSFQHGHGDVSISRVR